VKEDELIGKKVTVYFNLHKKLWSVKYKGRVVLHVSHISIIPTKLHINENARLKVIKDKCRMVHAWINGEIVDFSDRDNEVNHEDAFNYNPYYAGHFYYLNEKKNAVDCNQLTGIYFNGNDRNCYAI